MKKILIMLLAASMLTVLATGCNKKEENKTTGDSSSASDSMSGAAADSTSEKKEETTTEKKEETTTTKKETTAPPVYVDTEVWVLDFSKEADSDTPPFSPNQIDDLRIEGGLLKGTSTGGDPFLRYTGSDDLALNTQEINVVQIKLMNYTDSYDMQFFFTTPNVDWSEGASVKYYLDYGSDEDDNQWNIIEIDPFESGDWVDTMKSFRIDPFCTSGDFEIAYIKFINRTVEK